MSFKLYNLREELLVQNISLRMELLYNNSTVSL